MTMINPEAPVNTEAVPFEPMKMLREWHKATADKTVPGSSCYIEEPDAYSRKKNVSLRIALIQEESRETLDELLDVKNGCGDRVKLAKELADLVYVAFEAAANFEIPLEDVFREVHASNMTKVGLNGRVQRRGDGKILKGPNYREADIASIVLTGVSS